MMTLSSNSFAAKLKCDFRTGGDSQSIDGLSQISIKLEPFICQAKIEAGEMIRLRITHSLTNESVNETGYRSVTKKMYSVDAHGDSLDYATCTCEIQE